MLRSFGFADSEELIEAMVRMLTADPVQQVMKHRLKRVLIVLQKSGDKLIDERRNLHGWHRLDVFMHGMVRFGYSSAG